MPGGGVAELDDRFDHLAFLLVNDAFLFAFLDGGQDFILDFRFGLFSSDAPRARRTTSSVRCISLGMGKKIAE